MSFVSEEDRVAWYLRKAMNTCGDCKNYHPIDRLAGECKPAIPHWLTSSCVWIIAPDCKAAKLCKAFYPREEVES